MLSVPVLNVWELQNSKGRVTSFIDPGDHGSNVGIHGKPSTTRRKNRRSQTNY